MIKLTNEEYLNYVVQMLTTTGIEPHVKFQIIGTIEELLNYYSVEFVQDLLPTLLCGNKV
ncbi:hypothetical protein [Enterococcus avium]|uniref:hypothetical protein n=1 Tax=Enterococcus avium TaxID=33945 RepID=UPI001C84D041|nr:hypothetical protein [Enterococcus avium]MDT2449884.1 hypothetical protein [Enterococcus avium]